MSEISNKELIGKLEQIHKLSDLGNVDSVIKKKLPDDTDSLEVTEVLKIKAQIRELTERVEKLEKENKK